MPTNTFYNLSKEKQNKIIEASMNEFSKHSYDNVSINEIIDNAGISRGSFYMYFKDKEDLYYSLLDVHKNMFKSITRSSIENNNGDLFLGFIEMYDTIIKYILEQEKLDFFKNAFFNLNYKNEKCMVPNHEVEGKIIKEIENIVDLKKLNIKNNEDLADMFDIMMHILIKSVIKTIHNSDKERNKYVNKINLIKNGFERR